MTSDAPPPRQGPRNPGVYGPGARRGEDEFVRPAPDGLSGSLPSGIQQQPRLTPFPIEPCRIGPPFVEGGQQGLPGDRMKGSGGSGIKVGHTATLKRALAIQGRGELRDKPQRGPRPPNKPHSRAIRRPAPPLGVTPGAYATLPATPRRASARVWSA